MSYNVFTITPFDKQLKRLTKKFPSLKKDFAKLIEGLEVNPQQGSPLGNNYYKIRFAISSKGKGKSGGARVISLIETTLIGKVEMKNEEVFVNLITIYDKADTATISDKELKNLIKNFYQEK